MAEAVVGLLVGKLGAALLEEASSYGASLLFHEVSALKGLFGQIRKAKDELEIMQAYLNVAERFKDTDEITGLFVQRIRGFAFEIEDVVDEFTYTLEDKHGGFAARTKKRIKHVKTWHRLACNLQDINGRLQGAKQLPQQYCVPQMDRIVGGSAFHANQAFNFTEDEDLVGITENKEKLTQWLAGDLEKCKIATVWGMPGVGKTTLAAHVYKSIKIDFDAAAWVTVSHSYESQELLRKIAREFGTGANVTNMEMGRVAETIFSYLQGKRYILVLDDVWTADVWLDIRTVFPSNCIGRFVITTRNLELAKECCRGSSNCIYNIGLLNEVDSKKLILDRAFGIGHGCPKHLEDVLAQITRRCSGLPLALVTVPSMLEDKFSKDEWDRLVGSRWLSHPDAKVMKQIFNLSYGDLPHHLRACLLDLSIFPEDFKVDVDRLMRRWNAEGYIPKIHDLGVEEIARSYINELINRSMVQPLSRVHGTPRCFRLHPVIRDFLVCKSMEDNFVTLVDDQNPPISSNCRVYRRLSVQSSKHDQDLMSYDGMHLSHVRSFTVFGQASAAPCLTNLSVVRVLDLEGCVGPVCLDGLDKLFLLRYLSLKGTEVTELPATIWELRFLETLDIRSTKVKELSCSIVKLQYTLKNLLFSCEGMVNSIETTTRIAEHCLRLQNLATIDLREHRASFVKDLGDLNDLRMLEITWSFHQCTEGAYCEALLSSMEKWSKLRSLTIHCGGVGCRMEFLGSLSHPPEQLEEFKVTAGGFVSVPDWIKTLRYLYFLQITICKIGTDDLKILRDLPQLQCLILGLDFVPRNAIVIGNEGFSELLSFSVDCPVPWFTFQAGAMPKLTHLRLEFCSGSTNQESLPSGISNLQRLSEVVLLYNQKRCADSSSVRMTVDAVKRQVAKHHNPIDLIINDTKVDDVQEVDAEMKSTTEIQSSDVGEEIARTTVEMTQGEIEIEAECDNISSTY